MIQQRRRNDLGRVRHCVLAICASILLIASPAVADSVTDLCDRLIEEHADCGPTDTLAEMVGTMSATDQSPSDAGWEKLGSGFCFANMAEPALYCFAQAAKAAPRNASYLSNLGFVLLDTQQFDDADLALQTAYSVDADNPDLNMNLGKLRWKQGRQQDAISFLRIGAEDESHPNYAYALAKCLYYSNHQSEAVQVLEDNLNRFPTHAPSLELYRHATGETFKGVDVRKLAQEAIQLGRDLQASLSNWAEKLDRIAADAGDTSKPGTQMAKFHTQRSQITVTMVEQTLNNPHTTPEMGVNAAIHCYRDQIQLIAELYHWYYVCIHVWDSAPHRPHFDVEFTHGFAWKTDHNPFNEPRFAWEDAVNAGCQAPGGIEAFCKIVTPKAIAYLKEMPSREQTMTMRIRRALQDIYSVDGSLLNRFDDFYARAYPLMQTDLMKGIAAKQQQTLHDFFDPSKQVHSGLRWTIDETSSDWKHLLEYHRPSLENARSNLEDCGRQADGPKAPPDFEDFLKALAEAMDNDPNRAIMMSYGVVAISFAGDGTFSVMVGEALQAGWYCNAFTDNCGAKFGVGAMLYNPGVSGFGVSEGAYVVYDAAQGWGAEGTVSADLGVYQMGYSEQVWFSSLFE